MNYCNIKGYSSEFEFSVAPSGSKNSSCASATMKTFSEENITPKSGMMAKEERLILPKDIGTDYNYKMVIYWPNLIGFLILHFFALWGLWMLVSGQVMMKTILWAIFVGYAGSEGVTIGAHRLYTHKSFKAAPLLRAILIILQTVAGQNCMYIWVRDHRLHHRYSDTDADPHNAKRGFFFSHIGWLMSRKHPMVPKMGRTIDLSDLEADWMVMLQKKYYKTFYIIFAILIPVCVPVYMFGESWLVAFNVAYMFRYIFTLNGTWLVNSAAHIYGTRPYDKNLQPVESWFVSLISSGEGWHNYHHAYPWDYKAAELGMHFNFSATLIRWFESIGLASDLKVVPHDLVEQRILRTGDETHFKLGTDEGRAAVTTPGEIFKHPVNPFFTSAKRAPDVSLDQLGLPLSQEEDTQTQLGSEQSNAAPRRRIISPASK